MRLLIVFALISSFAFGQQDNQKLAYQYYINGEYDKAISIYKELNKEQFSVAYYAPYYSSLLKSERFREAEQLARKLAKIYPTSLNYQLEVGIAQEKSGNIRKAESTYDKLFQNLDGHRSQTITLANTYMRYAMYEDALKVYIFSEEINPKANFGIQKAQLYNHLGKADKMIKQYLEVLLRDPNQKPIVMSQVQRFLDNDGIKSDKNFTEVVIEDDGEGYPNEILSKIGEPYLRPFDKKNRNQTGLGLGIFIGKTLLEKNFASLNCQNSKTRTGAEVNIKWKSQDLSKI